MRMTASWFRSLDLPHTRLWRDSTAPESGLPSDCHPDCIIVLEAVRMRPGEIEPRTRRWKKCVTLLDSKSPIQARYAGLTGSPDESGRNRREKGLARSGNGRVRRGMVQLAWRFLTYQKESALAQWYRARTENARGVRKPMIVALARKLLIALWRFVWQGVVPDGVVLRPAQ